MAPKDAHRVILIADDDRNSRSLLTKILSEHEHDVLEASDGQQAWDLIVSHAPALVILDWMMPGIQSLELCRRIRKDPRFSSMYVILLTSRHNDEDLIAGLEAGADDYIRKPLRLNEFRARLNVALRIVSVSLQSDHLLSSLSSILIGLTADGIVTRWNSVAHRTFGISVAETIGRSLLDCGVDWTDRERVGALIRANERGSVHDELSYRDRNGHVRLIGVTITTMHLHGGRHSGRVILGADITERRLLEVQLRQSQKLEGIGQLAAGIAHEINTPMQYIGDNVRYLRDAMAGMKELLALLSDLGARAPAMSRDEAVALLGAIAAQADAADVEYLQRNVSDAVNESLEGVERVSSIVRAMKEFAHPDGGEREFVDINHSLETTLLVARNELKYVADVELALDPALPRVCCLAGELNQVFLNLLINAAHAIAQATKSSPGGRGIISVSTHVQDDGVEVRIADSGTGIPEHIRTRVFEPFFTTKEVGQGTGQGLAMAHATVVGRHQGRIWFDSVPGSGTTFFVRLPLASSRDETNAA